MIITDSTTREQLAAIVSERLRSEGIDVVLVGGSVVSIYSSGRYVTHDLDFVHWSRLKRIQEALRPLGFEMTGRIARHPLCPFVLDFNNPPIAIGQKVIQPESLAQLQLTEGTVTLLSPTHSVIDRLASYYWWDDLQSLEQAVDLVQANKIDIDEIKSWTEQEEKAIGNTNRLLPKFLEFLRLID